MMSSNGSVGRDQTLVEIVCPCGASQSPETAFRTPTRRYRRCSRCGLIFQSPRAPDDAILDYYRQGYDDAYGKAEIASGRGPVFEGIRDHLARFAQPPGRLLDLGCGDGEFLLGCQALGWTCFGLELSRPAAERAETRGLRLLPQEWLDENSPLETTDDRNDRFDVITLINVLEVVVDPLSLLRRIRAGLFPGGIVLIRVQNARFHLRVRPLVNMVGGRYQQAFHLYMYHPEALGFLLRRCDLEPVSVRNSRPTGRPVTGAEHVVKRLAWASAGSCLWGTVQAVFWLTGGTHVWAPSFELVARRKAGS